MCNVLVGKIIAIDGNTAIVDFSLAQRKAINLQGVRLNDFVVVRDNMIIEKLAEKKGGQLLKAQIARIIKKKKIVFNN